MTWNPVTGCLHGCDYCYARKITNRFGGSSLEALKSHIAKNKLMAKHGIDMGDTEVPKIFELDKKIFNITDIDYGFIDPYPYGFEPTFHKYRLIEPSKKIKGNKIFVCSMADLFGEWVPDEWIEEVFKACEAAPRHKYLFLTKNPQRYGQLNSKDHLYNWSFAKPNMWFGITVTGQKDLNRLRNLPYGHVNTFISIEPMQEAIDLDFYIPKRETVCKCSYCGHHSNHFRPKCLNCGKSGYYSGSFRKNPINWIIVGAQTGPGAVKPKPEWVQSIIDQCRSAGVPIFLKDNLNWPEIIQEFPEGLK